MESAESVESEWSPIGLGADNYFGEITPNFHNPRPVTVHTESEDCPRTPLQMGGQNGLSANSCRTIHVDSLYSPHRVRTDHADKIGSR